MTIEVVPGWTYDGGKPVQVLNQSGLSTAQIAQDPMAQHLSSQLTQWVEKARAVPQGGFLDRSVYSFADNPYDNMRSIRDAVTHDDIVGGVADATEAMAFDGGLKWESSEPDDADVFNQLSANWNLDNVIRVMWRDCFRYEQSVVAKLWAYQDFTVRGKTTKGNARKKVYRDVWAPIRLVTLNSLQVVPIFQGPLRNDQLAWQSSDVEVNAYMRAYRQDIPTDPLMTQFFTGTYTPSPAEAATLGGWGVDTNNLLALNPDYVFRHTSTRADYEPFAELRLRSALPLLDLKRQLIASDRATLVGAANYILLIRKGTDDKPATQPELQAMKENYNFLAKIPVIISDHRLTIDIVAPATDFVLQADHYDTLDQRILARALAAFTAQGGRGGSSTASASTFESALAKNIQNRRHMIKRTLEKEISRAIVEHPRNAGKFNSKPSLVFTPRTVSVGQNQYYMSTLLAMRNSREISRDTILEYMGLDEANEAQRLQVEEELYDQIFKTVSAITGQRTGNDAPDGTTNPTTDPGDGGDKVGTGDSPTAAGRRGGRPIGGRKPGTTARPGRNGQVTDNGNPSTGE